MVSNNDVQNFEMNYWGAVYTKDGIDTARAMYQEMLRVVALGQNMAAKQVADSVPTPIMVELFTMLNDINTVVQQWETNHRAILALPDPVVEEPAPDA
jgi:hypothetical protein